MLSAEMYKALPYFFMFEKVTKYFASKATGGAIDGVKESLNDKINQYGDILNFGLVLSVIILGGQFITKHSDRRERRYGAPVYIPGNLPPGSPPVVINNYYQQREPVNTCTTPYYKREEKPKYYGNNTYIKGTQPRTSKPAIKKR